MLQAVVYTIVTVILTKELVIATDQCTEYQFKYPLYPGVSCEDICDKNPESHQCSGYYWIVKRVFCGMTYTGSSCEHIYNKYPEIYKNNPKEKSGYYGLNNKKWTYCNMTEIAANDDDFTFTCAAAVEVIKSAYQSFLPGESCESIYNNNVESHEWSGYYWITSSRVYCGMNYTGSSCEDIYKGFSETQNKSGYYHIRENNKYQWTYCSMSVIQGSSDFIPACAGVGGGWRRIVNINISAGYDCPGEWRKATQSDVSFCRVASDDHYTCSSANFSTNGISYQRVCGRARGYQKGYTWGFYGSKIGRSIDETYVSGLSITFSSNPRQHIWTFASGFSERRWGTGNCPCSVYPGHSPSSFVGINYYCESGSSDYHSDPTYHFNDILWDGIDCDNEGTCCNDTTQPWFYRQLNQTTQEDVEV